MSYTLQEDSDAKVRVLLAEDDDLVARVMSVLLNRLGYDASRAATGPEAVAFAGREPFDIAFLDLEMPIFGGLEAARQILALPQPPVCIALTGSEREQDRRASLEAGMADYLVKPVRPDVLAATIEKHRRRKDQDL